MGFEVGKVYRIKRHGTEECFNASKIRVLMEDDRGFIIEHIAGKFAFPSNAPGSHESAVFRVDADKAVFWDEIKPLKDYKWLHVDQYGRGINSGGPVKRVDLHTDIYIANLSGTHCVNGVVFDLKSGDKLTWFEA